MLLSSYPVAGDAAVLLEHFLQRLIRELFAEILNVNIREALRLLSELFLAVLAWNEFTNEHLNKSKLGYAQWIATIGTNSYAGM